MDTAAITRLPRQLILLVTPLALAVVELTHPQNVTEANAGWWVTIHVIQLPLFGLMALAVLLLLDGTRGSAATISRIALGVFVVFYTMLDATAGIAAGIFLQNERGLPPAQHAGAAHVIAGFFADPTRIILVNIGVAGWLVAVLAACMALAAIPSPRLPLGLLLLGALLEIVGRSVDLPAIGSLGILGWIVCVFAAAYALYTAAAPKALLIAPLVLLIAEPVLVDLFPDDAYPAIGLTAGGLAVIVAVALAVRSRVVVGEGANARLYPLIPLALSGAILGWDHARPFGPVAFASFFLAAFWLERRREVGEPASARVAALSRLEPDPGSAV